MSIILKNTSNAGNFQLINNFNSGNFSLITPPNLITNGLILYLDAGNQSSYPGSGSTWYDLSGNNNTGTLINGPTYNTSSGGFIAFDGINDYVDGGTYTGLGTSNRTISIWFQIKSISLSGGKRILTLASTSNTNIDTPAFTIGYNTNINSLSMGFGGSPYNGYMPNTTFTLNSWINIQASITSNTLSAYINGVLIGNYINTGGVGSNPILYLGRYNDFYNQYGDVNISQTLIYNRALSTEEITQNFNATKGRFGF